MSDNQEKTGESAKPPTEIERKFLVSALPGDLDLTQYPAEKIDQGYLANTPDYVIRVRRKGNRCFLTYKSAPTNHTAERVELETELTEDRFLKMWPRTEGKRLEKTRYRIPFGAHTIELDVFEGDNTGSILAEVEFNTTNEADEFQPPEWFGADVTADKRFGNGNIAEFGFPDPAS